MTARFRPLLCCAVLALTAFGAHAQNRPGLWEYTTDFYSPATDQERAELDKRLRAMKPAERKEAERKLGPGATTVLRRTTRMCRTEADIRRVYLSLPAGHDQRCAPATVRPIAARTVAVTLACKGAPPTTGEGEFVFDDDVTMKGNTTLKVSNGAATDVHRIQTQGKWLGADCRVAGLKGSPAAGAPAAAAPKPAQR